MINKGSRRGKALMGLLTSNSNRQYQKYRFSLEKGEDDEVHANNEIFGHNDLPVISSLPDYIYVNSN